MKSQVLQQTTSSGSDDSVATRCQLRLRGIERRFWGLIGWADTAPTSSLAEHRLVGDGPVVVPSPSASLGEVVTPVRL